jgi:hypothetical protein
MPPERPVSEMPSEVLGLYETLRRPLEEAGISVLAGYERGRWVVGADLPGGGLRVPMIWRRHEWQVDVTGFQVFAGGRDVSAQAAGDVAKALALLAAPGEAGLPGEGPVKGSPAKVKASASVQVRRTEVMRN